MAAKAAYKLLCFASRRHFSVGSPRSSAPCCVHRPRYASLSALLRTPGMALQGLDSPWLHSCHTVTQYHGSCVVSALCLCNILVVHFSCAAQSRSMSCPPCTLPGHYYVVPTLYTTRPLLCRAHLVPYHAITMSCPPCTIQGHYGACIWCLRHSKCCLSDLTLIITLSASSSLPMSNLTLIIPNPNHTPNRFDVPAMCDLARGKHPE